MGPEDRQFPEFFVSQYGRLRRLGFLLTGDPTFIHEADRRASDARAAFAVAATAAALA